MEMTGLHLDQQQLVQGRCSRSATSVSPQSKPILSLDGFLIGHIVTKSNGKVTIVNGKGDQFILPDCRIIISSDKSLMNSFVVDIEYHELSKYRTIEYQPGNKGGP
jgi:hypothetical protein